jgi:uncharacterized protein
MKMKWCVTGFLLLVLCAGVTVAQQTGLGSLWDIVRNVSVEDLKSKAKNGDARSQCVLGFRYFNGIGIVKDNVEAAKWFRKSAEQGDVDAQGLLGLCYEQGKGVSTNIMEAIKWDRLAAEQGSAADQNSLGFIYSSGREIAQDYVEAAKWFHRAAEQGNFIGQHQFANCCYFGRGVPVDYVEAYKWYNLAAAQGVDDEANQNREIISRKMTPEQIAEAQRRSAEFVPKKEKPGSNPANSAPSTKPSFTGTGFFITDDGYLISNYHVVKDAAKVRLITSAGLIDAKVVSVDAANDLALLKATGKFLSLPIVASRTASLGGTVATVGFPNIGLQGFSPKLAKGEIASLSGVGDDARYFQISVPVQPGNSGGALVDEFGNVVGIVSAKLDASVALASSGSLPENVNYAVKSSLLLSFLESVPAVSAKLKSPNTKDEKFSDVVKSAQDAAVLVLVY